MRRQWQALLALVFVFIFASSLHAQNFENLGVSVGSGARALGMGGAFIAVADDATAASWNPAGLCVLDDPEVSFVWKAKNSTGTQIAPVTRQIGDQASSNFLMERLSATSFSSSGGGFDFASATYPLQIGKLKLVPQISMQRAIDFHFEEKQGQPLLRNDNGASDGDISRLTQSETNHFDSDGSLDVWAASLGVSFHPKLYLGATLNWWTGRARFDSKRFEETLFCTQDECIPNTLDSSVNSSRSFDGFNLNIGALWKPAGWMNVGFVYKTPFQMEHHFDFQRAETVQFPDAAFQTHEIYSESGEIQWPRTLGAGVAWMPRQEITVAADYSQTAWSSAKYKFNFHDTISDSFEYIDDSGTRTAIWPTYFDPSQPENVFNQRQPDTWQLRAGAEYVFLSPFIVPLRVGIYRNRQFVKDGAGDPVTHTGLAFGFGFARSNFSVDMALVHESTSVTGCDYTIEAFDGSVETCQSDYKDTFQSNRLYLSSIYRF